MVHGITHFISPASPFSWHEPSRFKSHKHELRKHLTPVDALTCYEQDLINNFVWELTLVFHKVKKNIIVTVLGLPCFVSERATRVASVTSC